MYAEPLSLRMLNDPVKYTGKEYYVSSPQHNRELLYLITIIPNECMAVMFQFGSHETACAIRLQNAHFEPA